jgi:hypothetical protein
MVHRPADPLTLAWNQAREWHAARAAEDAATAELERILRNLCPAVFIDPPVPLAIGNRAAERKSGSSNAETTAPDRSAQRAVDLAARRAAELERRVLILASIGQRKAADRLTATAAKLRGVVR